MTTPTNKRIVLVTGATGKQGSAATRHILALPTSSPTASETDQGGGASVQQPVEWHVWALTRNPSSPAAHALAKEAERNHTSDRLKLVQGDLDVPASIRSVFEEAADEEGGDGDGGIWGVFAVFEYPGPGVKSDREKHQATALAQLALDFKIHAYVYSTTIPAGPKPEDAIEPAHRVKVQMQEYIQKELGPKGLNWIFLRPGFFMENFDGRLGPLCVTLFRDCVKKDTTITPVATDDIGRVAAGIFKNNELYIHKIINATSGPTTIQEMIDGYQRATGKPIRTAPAFLVKSVVRFNATPKNIIKQVERNHEARTKTGECPTFEAEVALAKSICEIRDYEAWTRWKIAEGEHGKGEEDHGDVNWNNVSIFKLFTGRS
ncbi:hypothetical protein B0H63DRAFT_255971 [Podospora didyma]|uniref:NmrA-like domain-containing protein n=1 Tax=Podospora didyma TaxID=330526 RepID=A0AAE0KDB3_9PEZI|nr:hypothetical protein B0H63DRAFT_255971 [Podospora didyma]